MSEVEPAPVTGATAPGEPDVKRCPNCGASAAEKFCPNCGQETKLRLPTLREFLREAAGRYVAFDGRFWRTMLALMFRPGRLTREYFAGRRRRYIRPARLYLFSTLIFFAVTRFFVEPATIVNLDSEARSEERKKAAESVERSKSGEGETGLYLDNDGQLHVPDNLPGGSILKQRWQRFERLPTNEKTEQLAEGMLRYGPYAMFCLLPAFAFLLKLVYTGRRRRYPQRPRLYGEHMVFAAHGHAFFFVACTAALLVPNRLFRAAAICWVVIYLWRSLRAVYGGSWLGAGLRGSFLFLAYSVLVGIATAGLLIAAILLR